MPSRRRVSTPAFVLIGIVGLTICTLNTIESTGAWLVASIVLTISFAAGWALTWRARRSDQSRHTA